MMPQRTVVQAGRSGAMKLIYKPLGIGLGLVAGIIGRAIFGKIWGLIDDEEPPEGTTQEVSWPKVLIAAALQGMIFRVVKVAVERAGAKGWNHLTGVWPGETRADPE
jgi:Protein of unknown function (DUF4235)